MGASTRFTFDERCVFDVYAKVSGTPPVPPNLEETVHVCQVIKGL